MSRWGKARKGSSKCEAFLGKAAQCQAPAGTWTAANQPSSAKCNAETPCWLVGQMLGTEAACLCKEGINLQYTPTPQTSRSNGPEGACTRAWWVALSTHLPMHTGVVGILKNPQSVVWLNSPSGKSVKSGNSCFMLRLPPHGCAVGVPCVQVLFHTPALAFHWYPPGWAKQEAEKDFCALISHMCHCLWGWLAYACSCKEKQTKW